MELFALTMPPNMVCYDNHPLAPLSVLGGACLGAHYFPLLPILHYRGHRAQDNTACVCDNVICILCRVYMSLPVISLPLPRLNRCTRS